MIYFIQCGEGGPVKIGWSRKVLMLRQRVSLFQTGHPEPLSLLGFVEGDKSVEREFHEMFAADRLRGEWFRPSPGLLRVAECRITARQELDSFQARRRWRDWGLVDAAGSFTEAGAEYLLMCEYKLALADHDLGEYAQWAAQWAEAA